MIEKQAGPIAGTVNVGIFISVPFFKYFPGILIWSYSVIPGETTSETAASNHKLGCCPLIGSELFSLVVVVVL